MPQVPKYQPQVREAGFPNEKLSSNADLSVFGGGQSVAQVNQATQGVAKDIIDYQKEERTNAMDLRLSEKRRGLNDFETQKIYSKNGGAAYKLGQDALGVHDALLSDFDKYVEEQTQTLPNDELKVAYTKMAQARRESINQWAIEHVAKQTKIVEEEDYKANLQSSKDLASLDPRNAARESEAVRKAVDQKALREGIKGPSYDALLKNEMTDFHASVIRGMLARNQDLSAKAYFDRVKDGMDQTKASELAKSIDSGVSNIRAEQIAMEIVKNNPSKGSAMAALDQLKGEEARLLKDNIRQRVNNRFSDMASAKKEAQDQNFEQVMKILEQSKSRDAVPEYMWQAMPFDQRKAAEAYIEKGSEKTDWAKYTDIKLLASNPATRDKFLETNPLQYKAYLAPPEYKEIIKLWEKGKSGDHRDLDGIFSTTQYVDGLLQTNHEVNTKAKPGSAQAKTRMQILLKVDEMIRQQKEQGKTPSRDDIKRFVGQSFVEVVTEKGWLWDTTKKAFELQPGEEALDLVIPRAEKAKIIETLKANKKAITKENINYLYLKFKGDQG